jgi:hypothetical protein
MREKRHHDRDGVPMGKQEALLLDLLRSEARFFTRPEILIALGSAAKSRAHLSMVLRRLKKRRPDIEVVSSYGKGLRYLGPNPPQPRLTGDPKYAKGPDAQRFRLPASGRA